MGTSQRNKGKRGERLLAAALRAVFPDVGGIRRGWQVREGDDDPDVMFPGIWFESKFLAKFNTSPLDQAVDDSKGRGVPIAVIRVTRKEPVVMMRLSDFLVFLRKVWWHDGAKDVHSRG